LTLTKQPVSPADLGALSQLAPELAHTFASVAGDIALVIDVSGVIRNVAVGGNQPLPESAEQWIGRRWAETASDETRGKIELLLQEAVDVGISRRREVSLPLAGVDVPVAYAAIRLGEYGPVLAVGRDLRALAAIRQRFADTQQQMEREYWKKRQTESRYRMLFQVATDAVLVVDAQSLQVIEANRAAAQLFDLPLEGLIGRPVTVAVDRGTRPAVQALLARARESGRPAEARARLANRVGAISMSAAPFRSDGALHLLVRARAADVPEQVTGSTPHIAELVERIPDGVVITDAAGRIVMANPAFLELCAIPDEAQIRGVQLNQWLGQSEDDLAALLVQVRSRGIAPQVRTVLRVAEAMTFDVEISAALLEDTEQENIGLTVRRLAGRAPVARPLLDELSCAVQHLSRQVGHEPLPGLLRQVTELAEKHFIAASVERADGDLDRAAALLGVSRRSLELRLQRHGLLAGDGEPAPPAGDQG
jgi:transcriptional regulator PpsR